MAEGGELGKIKGVSTWTMVATFGRSVPGGALAGQLCTDA